MGARVRRCILCRLDRRLERVWLRFARAARKGYESHEAKR